MKKALKNFGLVLMVLAFAVWPPPKRAIQYDLILFSNDAPFGLMSSQAHQDASTVKSVMTGEGYWNNLNWIGSDELAMFNVSWLLFSVFNFLFFGSLLFVLFMVWVVVRNIRSFYETMNRRGRLVCNPFILVPMLLVAANEFVNYGHITFRLFFYFTFLWLFREAVEYLFPAEA